MQDKSWDDHDRNYRHGGDSRDPRPPDAIIRVHNVKASLWVNDGDYGPYYNIKITRVYRNKRYDPQNPSMGDEWKHTSNFGYVDLLKVKEVVDLAHKYIMEQKNWLTENAPMSYYMPQDHDDRHEPRTEAGQAQAQVLDQEEQKERW